jgi:protoporphyrinogen oxidase
MPDDEIVRFAIAEVEKIGILGGNHVRDSVVVRVPKTYPAYFGTYDRFDEIVRYIDRFENLFLLGRNGMHKYNNQDHSMLTAMTAVDQIVAGQIDKTVLWEINTEQEYHEEKK